jgi:hypothetical protein
MVLEFLDPAYAKLKLDNLDISLTTLRDALRGADNRTLTDIYNVDNNILSKLDVTLSTRASETTLSGIKTQIDKLTFDTNNYLQVNVKALVNPPALDVNLSTRASDSTLSAFSGKFPTAVALADNLSNPTTTIIGAANLGFDGTNWRRIVADTSGRLKVALDSIPNPSNLDISLSSLRDALRGTGNKTLTDLDTDLNNILSRLPASLTASGNFKIAIQEDAAGILKDTKIPNPLGIITNQDVIGSTANVLAVVDMLTPSRQPYTIPNISVSTTEASTSISAPGAKILIIKNKGDTDVLIGINGSVPTTNPLIVRARAIKVIPHKGVTQVNYKVASGTSTIDIEYYN